MMQTQRHNLVYGEGLYVGIDPSLRSTGVAILDPKEITTYLLAPPKGVVSVERLAWLKANMTTLLGAVQRRAKAVAIEGYAHGRANQAHQVGEWGGILRLMLRDMGMQVVEVAPMSLKKFVTGKGNVAGKAPILLHLYKRWGIELSQEDEADAAGLALACAYHQDEGITRTAAQAEAVAKFNLLLTHGPRHRAR